MAASSDGHHRHAQLQGEELAARSRRRSPRPWPAPAPRAPASPTSSTPCSTRAVGDTGQERVGHRLVHHEGLGRVADARALGLGVDDDVERVVEVGAGVDVDVAVAVAVDDDRHGRVVADALDQRRTTARDEAVDDVGELHELDRGLVADVVDEQHRVGGQARPWRGRRAARRRWPGSSGARWPSRAGGGVARLQADAGGVAGDVGPVLVDDRDDAERHPDAARSRSPFGRRQPSSTSPIGSGSAATCAQAVGHAGDPGVGEAEPVERPGVHPGRVRGLDVEPVRRQQVGGALVEEVGRGQQRGVLLRGGGRRQQRGGGLRPPPELGHGQGRGHGGECTRGLWTTGRSWRRSTPAFGRGEAVSPASRASRRSPGGAAAEATRPHLPPAPRRPSKPSYEDSPPAGRRRAREVGV